MSLRRPPAFQFYVARFSRETAGFTAIERGAEIALMCHAWEQGTIPGDFKSRARIAGLTFVQFRSAWETLLPRWRKVRKGFASKTLQTERRKQQYLRALNQQKGRRGAAKRWHSRGHAGAIAEAWPTDGSPKDLDQEQKIKTQTREHRNGFRLPIVSPATMPVLVKLAHTILDEIQAGKPTPATVSELRARCAEARIDYKALPVEACRQALDQAESQRRKHAHH